MWVPSEWKRVQVCAHHLGLESESAVHMNEAIRDDGRAGSM